MLCLRAIGSRGNPENLFREVIFDTRNGLRIILRFKKR
jgi:hypothetical protein